MDDYKWYEYWAAEAKEFFDFLKNLAVIAVILYCANRVYERISGVDDDLYFAENLPIVVWLGFVSVILLFANCVRYWNEARLICIKYKKRSYLYIYYLLPIFIGLLSIAFLVIIASEKFKFF